MREYLEALRRFYIDLWKFHLRADIQLQRERAVKKPGGKS